MMNTFGIVMLAMRAFLPQDQDYRVACQASDARALCDAEASVTDALRRNSAGTLADSYADEFQLINFRGTQVNKAGVLAAIRSGALRFENLSTSELQLRIYGNTGVITGRQLQVAREPGADNQAHPNDVRFTHIYVLRGGRWQLVISQITPIVASAPRP
jgi:ketosteroid isomerase-like protein